MAETHQAELFDNPGQIVTITDPDPLESARLFKFVSDRVWGRDEDNRMSVRYTPSVVPANEALVMLNDVISEIGQHLIVAGGDSDLKLLGGRNEEVEITQNVLATPEDASLETFNWDEQWTYRPITVDGERTFAQFTDGHFDYARELAAGFHFRPAGEALVVRYVMQRYQYGQDSTTELYTHVWHSRFAETGYEGNALDSQELTEAQEIAVLNVFAHIGGIATEGFTRP